MSKLIVKTIESPDGTPVAFTTGIVQVNTHISDLNVHLEPSDRATIAALTGVTVTTADINSIVSKAPINNPTFTGTVFGVTKSMVGLGNVDNTSDINKPINNNTQLALNTKAAIASPAFTGVPSAPTALSSVDNTQLATTAFANTASTNALATAEISSTAKANAAQAASTPIAHVGTGGTAHANASTTVAGFMSASDKVKLDAVSGTNTGDQTTITGNAGTATALQTARTINGVNFDGSANISINAVDITGRIASSLIGAANGVAPLGADSKISANYLPSYVDDVIEVANYAALPLTGETGKIYIDLATNKTYRWSGTAYVYITSGAVDSVAGKTGVVSLVKADVGLVDVDNTSDANKPVSTAQQTALALKLNVTSYTPTDVLAKLLTVDGAGSGLDADTLDGLNSSQFLRADVANAGITLPNYFISPSSSISASGGEAALQAYNSTGGAAFMAFHRAGLHAVNIGLDIDNQVKIGGWSFGVVAYTILHSGNYNNYSTFTGNISSNGKIILNGTVIAYRPTAFLGTLVLGNGGANLSNTASSEGHYNTFVGINAGFNTTTGSFNTANGFQSLYCNTTGYQNTATGLNALNSNTTGYQNTATGLNTLNSNTTGYHNTATGLNALYKNTTGYQNTATGPNALYYNTTGLNNVGLGASSGHNPDNDIAQYQITTDTNMTLLGYGATKNNVAQLTNSTAIGSGAMVTASNQVVLGNVAVTETVLKGTISSPSVSLSGVAPANSLVVNSAGITSATRLKTSTSYTVATLPIGTVGERAYVTDATTPTFLGTLTGGGSVVTPVFHNGTAWVAG